VGSYEVWTPKALFEVICGMLVARRLCPTCFWLPRNMHQTYASGSMANRSYVERYFELLKDAKVKGYLFAQQNYIDEPFKKQ
jgi:hypothetical protein